MSTHLRQSQNPVKVLLCVSGGIAAYKSAEVLRDLTESGCDVTVIATESALAFVGGATWAALSGKPVATSMWQSTHDVPHISLARWADVIAVVPATADALARIADGRASDLLSAVCLMAEKPVAVFPAMHTEMWRHAATAAHVAALRDRGVLVVQPDSGRLTGADSGIGRLGDPRSIAMIIRQLARATTSVTSLAGKHVVVTAGGTREPVDAVRVITNKSSGLMAYACAAAAVAAGARVTVIAANVALPSVAGATTVPVETHAQMSDALGALIADADAVVMAAAVSDYAPQARAEKLKKDGHALSLEFEELPDILAGLAQKRQGSRPLLVGFAAETAGGRDRLVELARGKLARKGCDVIVANDVSGGAVFARLDTEVVLVDAAGHRDLGPTSKEAAASAVIATVAQHLQ